MGTGILPEGNLGAAPLALENSKAKGLTTGISVSLQEQGNHDLLWNNRSQMMATNI